MQVYQHLTITGQNTDLETFLVELDTNSCGWTPNPNILQSGGLGSDYKAYDVPQAVLSRSARLFLHVNASRTECSLANIVPGGGQLSPKEYNTILQAFYANCVQEKLAAYHLIALLTKPEVFLENTLSPENLVLLVRFAHGANPATGSSHPQDYRRWIAFISASVQDNQVLDVEILRGWLMEQGFSADVAFDLTTEYQFGVDLIRQVNQVRNEQDNVHVAA